MRNRLANWMVLLTLSVTVSVAVTACGTLTSGSSSPATTVIGQGIPSVDVAAVQAAVDRGGTVRLKGSFDFGEKGNVNLTRDVSILGDADAAGKPLTAIKGGWATIRSLRTEGTDGPGPKIAIKQIHFDGATWMPIQLTFASGVDISGNTVTRVKPAAFEPDRMSQGKPFNMQHGVVIGGVAIEPTKAFAYRPDAVTGKVRITDNVFDLASDAPTTTIGMAVFMAYATGVDAEIARNTIRNVPRNGIETIDNYRAADGSGQIVLRENDIETPLQGTPWPSPRTPNGILVGYFLDSKAAVDEKRALSHTVIKNKIRVRGRTQSSWGIAVLADRNVVVDNEITLDSAGAVAIAVSGSHNIVERNKLDGAGAFGVAFGPYPPMKASFNQLVNNDVTRLKASRGEFAMSKGADRNRVLGSTGTVSDAGEGNVTDGLKPFAAPAK